MRSLWRAMALIWLGGVGSPALMDDPAGTAQIEMGEQEEMAESCFPIASDPVSNHLASDAGDDGRLFGRG